jgi:hypothetical protein
VDRNFEQDVGGPDRAAPWLLGSGQMTFGSLSITSSSRTRSIGAICATRVALASQVARWSSEVMNESSARNPGRTSVSLKKSYTVPCGWTTIWLPIVWSFAGGE